MRGIRFRKPVGRRSKQVDAEILCRRRHVPFSGLILAVHGRGRRRRFPCDVPSYENEFPLTFPLEIHVARGVVGKRTRFSWYTVSSQWQVGQGHFINNIPRLVLDWPRKLLLDLGCRISMTGRIWKMRLLQ